jgi:DNA-binding transcriptional ArsR family regulator
LTRACVCTYALAMGRREEAAAACLDALDGPFLKALAEPARVALLRVLILRGRLDVGSIAAEVPQDRSVVARHLQLLERSKVLRSSTEGRHTFYEIDGPGVLGQLESLLKLFQKLSPICCPK